MERELVAMSEQAPGPMDHAKVERKCTVMYSATGVKVFSLCPFCLDFGKDICLSGHNNSAEVTAICQMIKSLCCNITNAFVSRSTR